MTFDPRHHEVPAAFLHRYRPTKPHGHEKGVAAYLFDPFGLTFYERLSREGSIPGRARWSVRPCRKVPGTFTLSSQIDADSSILGYVVATVERADDDPAEYPLAKLLTHRTKIRLAILTELTQEFSRDDELSRDKVLQSLTIRINAIRSGSPSPITSKW